VAYPENSNDCVQAHLAGVRQLAQLAQSEGSHITVITNGRVVPFPAGALLDAGDLEVMSHVAQELLPGTAVQQLVQAARDEGRARGVSARQLSDLVMAAASVAALPPQRDSLGGGQSLYAPGNLRQSVQLQDTFEVMRNSSSFVRSVPQAPCSDRRNLIQVMLLAMRAGVDVCSHQLASIDCNYGPCA
jgi:hypothetical protein